MTHYRTRSTAGAATAAFVLALAAPNAAWSQPIPRFAQPDVPSLAAVAHPLPALRGQDSRSPAVEREHLKAQRIINRVCSGC
jgi:hypothetical protein